MSAQSRLFSWAPAARFPIRCGPGRRPSCWPEGCPSSSIAGAGFSSVATAAGVGANQLTATLLTHLHSDHLTDLNDVITTRWVTTFAPSPLVVIGPPGTGEVVDGIRASLRPDVAYRLAHTTTFQLGTAGLR